MAVNIEAYQQLKKELNTKNVTLVAVSKFKPAEDIQTLYDLGQRDFGENFVQELLLKQQLLPKDIRWHFIGHLQSNKVKYIAPFIHLIHGVDSEKLLKEIDKQGAKNNRIISCLLQVFIADEETKFGFDEAELSQLKDIAQLEHVRIKGFMGMASFSEDKEKVSTEFRRLQNIFSKPPSNLNAELSTLSMGMSGDYESAIKEGSNMVRIGSLLFGQRNIKTS